MNREQRRAAVKSGKNPEALAITWASNAPWAGTGYGTGTAHIAERLHRDGHKVAVAAMYGLQAMQTEWNGVPIYPMGFDAYSNDTIPAHYRDWSRRNPDLTSHLVVLFDAWVLKGPQWDDVPMSIWTMVDHLPCPPDVAAVLAKKNVTPLAVSRFGQTEIERQGIEARYIPMTVDTKTYRPTASFQGHTGREMMGLDEDCFVVSLINANKGVEPSRKAWGENLLAFSIFAQRHPDVRLYIHTERFGNMAGIRMDPLIKAVGLEEHQYRFVNQYANLMGIPNEGMAALYTATDVLLASTMGEGFGLTAIEAAATSTVVIANDFSASPELIGEGWLTDGQPRWDPMQSAWFNTPSVPSIVDCLEQAYQRGRGRSQAQMDHAAMYDADRVFDTYWRPYLAELAAPKPTTSPVALPATTWTRNADAKPAHLTIYIPTHKRPSLSRLLASLAPQLDDRVEVIVSDNDPAASGLWATKMHLADTPCRVDYSARSTNIGGNENILRGFEQGTAPWVWVIGDDDEVLPGAVANVLSAIDHDDIDRLILLSRQAPSKAAGMLSDPAGLAAIDPGLLIAATLISANVVRRSSLDLKAGREHIDTMYGHSWANTSCRRVKVLASPAIKVGIDNVGQFVAEHGEIDPLAVWSDLLSHGYGVVPTEDSFGWNFASVAQSA